MKAVIGHWQDHKPAVLDVAALISSRMLICANSGGGKSYLCRKTIEALDGYVQQIVIDTDGEFATLREKYDFVICAPKGGDAVAHPKTAALLCRRLLETGVSAIVDISELKAPDRHLFVKIFLETLMNLGKELWHSMALHLDEAHIYCPEKGQGESIAADAVIDLASRGRKRGYFLVAATQRVAKLRKDAAAELLNRLIGRTGLDLDVKRAAFDLGMSPKDAQSILPHLEPGEFFAFGPAISKTVARMTVDKVATSHPKAGTAQARTLPKPTKAITSILPQLADLQKESDEEAKTLQDMRVEIAGLKQQVRVLSKTAPAVVTQDPAKVQELRGKVRQLQSVVGELMKFVVKIQTTGYDEADKDKLIGAIQAAVSTMAVKVDAMATAHRGKVEALQAQAANLVQRAQLLLDEKIDLTVQVSPQPPTRVQVTEPKPRRQFGDAPIKVEGLPVIDEAVELTKPQREILNAIAWLNHKGIEQPTREMVSAICKKRGGAYNNNVSSLKVRGYLHYPVNGLMALTPGGEQFAEAPRDDGRSLFEHWLEVVTNPQRDILQALMQDGQAVSISRDDLSQRVGKSGGAFNNNVSALSSMGALYYPQKGSVMLTKNVVP